VNPTMAEWRKVANTVSDGPGQDRTEVTYAFGAEYDGVFVPALTKSQGYFEHLLDRGKQDAEKAETAKDNEAGWTNTPGAATTAPGA
jgi:hypothetical protein